MTVREHGAGGALVTLLGAGAHLVRAEVVARRRGDGPLDLVAEAHELRDATGADIALAVSARRAARIPP